MKLCEAGFYSDSGLIHGKTRFRISGLRILPGVPCGAVGKSSLGRIGVRGGILLAELTADCRCGAAVVAGPQFAEQFGRRGVTVNRMGLGDLTIAAAQCTSQPGAVERNVETHLLFARAAAEHGVVLLVFPELSLIGYELDLASRHVLGSENAALQPLRQFARESALTLVAGGPVRGEGGVLHIGAFVFQPDGAVAIYTKQHVHSSEEHVFTSGPGGELVSIADARVALAICADASHPQHAAHAASGGANIYAAGVMIAQDAYARKTALMQSYAEEHGMAVLMANYSGATGGDVSAGGSAIWAEGGVPIARAKGNAECLVIGLRQSGAWAGSVVLL